MSDDLPGFTPGLVMVLTFGAANADATPEQRVRLRAVATMLEDPEIPMERVARSVFEVMGPAWSPTGEWLAYLESLIPDLRPPPKIPRPGPAPGWRPGRRGAPGSPRRRTGPR